MRNNSVKYFKFGPVVQEMFKRLLTWSSGGPPVWWIGTIYEILKEGIMENFRMKFMEIVPVVQEEMLFKEKVYITPSYVEVI